MPELPEVEIITRGLRQGNGAPPLPGQRIAGTSLRWPRHIATPSVSAFRRRIRNRVFMDAQRRGKYLVFQLDRGTLIIHLKMSGDLHMMEQGTPQGKYDHTIFKLENGWELRFSDSRKFGRVYLIDNPQDLLGRLGPEPLEEDFTPNTLETLIKGRKRQLKSLLLDQSFIAGLGNIYVDESLHRARLHPLRRSDSLKEVEIHALWQGIRDALHQGLEHNGASIDWVFRGGGFQNHFQVYQRTGEPCPACKSPIERILVGQRSTHFCPTCQLEDPV